MSDGRKAAYDDEMEEWRARQVEAFQRNDMGKVLDDLKLILNMLQDFHATDPVLTNANHYRLTTARKKLRELLT